MDKIRPHIKDVASFLVKYLLVNNCLEKFEVELKKENGLSIIEFVEFKSQNSSFHSYEKLITFAFTFSTTDDGYDFWTAHHYNYVKEYSEEFGHAALLARSSYKSIW